MLCFRLALLTNTSVEYYMGLPYSDLIDFTNELMEQQERRKRSGGR